VLNSKLQVRQFLDPWQWQGCHYSLEMLHPSLAHRLPKACGGTSWLWQRKQSHTQMQPATLVPASNFSPASAKWLHIINFQDLWAIVRARNNILERFCDPKELQERKHNKLTNIYTSTAHIFSFHFILVIKQLLKHKVLKNTQNTKFYSLFCCRK
jgi:hypothetical protein